MIRDTTSTLLRASIHKLSRAAYSTDRCPPLLPRRLRYPRVALVNEEWPGKSSATPPIVPVTLLRQTNYELGQLTGMVAMT